MTKGAKIAGASAVVFVLAVAIRVGLIYKANHDDTAPAAPQAAGSGYKMSDDDATVLTLKKKYPDSMKDARALIGTTLWVSAGGQMDYYKDSGNHVDYAKPVDTLPGATELEVKGVFEQVPPKTGRAVARIAAGQRHVLLAFTMPKSADPKQLYAVPVGNYDNGAYTFLTDEIFFYDDPHVLYKHWGPEMWSHIDKHEAVLGMSENQAMMSLGQVINPHGDKMGDRSVTFDNDSKPVTIVFENGKATKITPGT
jgi:hypothetical protein